jgi:hypothetical protein
MDMMLDIETLGREPGCAVLSIGATMFNPDDPDSRDHLLDSNHFYVAINNFDSLSNGFGADPETLKWWKKQKVWSQLGAEIANSNVTVAKSCELLSEFSDRHRPVKIWANSPTFDIEILKSLFRKSGVSYPFSYRQEMDFRTTMELAFKTRDQRPVRTEEISNRFLPHHALGDAIHQAHQILMALSILRPKVDLQARAARDLEQIEFVETMRGLVKAARDAIQREPDNEKSEILKKAESLLGIHAESDDRAEGDRRRSIIRP